MYASVFALHHAPLFVCVCVSGLFHGLLLHFDFFCMVLSLHGPHLNALGSFVGSHLISDEPHSHFFRLEENCFSFMPLITLLISHGMKIKRRKRRNQSREGEVDRDRDKDRDKQCATNL